MMDHCRTALEKEFHAHPRKMCAAYTEAAHAYPHIVSVQMVSCFVDFAKSGAPEHIDGIMDALWMMALANADAFDAGVRERLRDMNDNRTASGILSLLALREKRPGATAKPELATATAG